MEFSWQTEGIRSVLSVGLLALVLSSGCSPKRLDGVYTFRSPRVDETLVLKPDGTFAQTIVMGGRTNRATGQWSATTSEAVTLRGFLVRYDTMSDRLIPPEESSSYEGYWDARRRHLYFDVDNEGKYYLVRSQ